MILKIDNCVKQDNGYALVFKNKAFDLTYLKKGVRFRGIEFNGLYSSGRSAIPGGQLSSDDLDLSFFNGYKTLWWFWLDFIRLFPVVKEFAGMYKDFESLLVLSVFYSSSASYVDFIPTINCDYSNDVYELRYNYIDIIDIPSIVFTGSVKYYSGSHFDISFRKMNTFDVYSVLHWCDMNKLSHYQKLIV